MFKKYLNKQYSVQIYRYLSQNYLEDKSIKINNDLEVVPDEKPNRSVLEECREDISYIAPALKPTFNFAAYVNRSETLQQLVKLGVNLYKLEKDPELPPYLLKLDFERDIKDYLTFLNDLNIDNLGEFITKNPYIFQQNFDDLHVRINYLKYKKFDNDMIKRIIEKNPKWLSFSTQDINEKLGFFQHMFKLSGNQVRALATRSPKLITYSQKHVKLNKFTIEEEMGFTRDETKQMLLEVPLLFIKEQNFILKTFEYVHNTMKIPLEQIVKMPQILIYRQSRVKQRHEFLTKLERAQYNPKQPNYVSLLALVSGTDHEFCDAIAKTSIQTFNTFLKSI